MHKIYCEDCKYDDGFNPQVCMSCLKNDNCGGFTKPTATIKLTGAAGTVGRVCQVCGKGTEGIDFTLCPECKSRLFNLLYGEGLKVQTLRHGKRVTRTLACLDKGEQE